MFGKIKSFDKEDNKIKIHFQYNTLTVEIINSGIVNFFVPLFRVERASKAVESFIIQECDFQVIQEDEGIVITTEKLKVKIFEDFKVDIYDNLGNVLCEDYREDRCSFIRRYGNLDVLALEGHKVVKDSKYKVMVLKKMEGNTFFYGLGEQTGHLNKKGYHYKMWNTDDPSPHVECDESLYKTIPFFIALKNKQAFGIFFDNTFETHFDMGKENADYFSFSAVDGNLDYYFIYGPSVKQVVGGYTKLTGTTPLPQMWTLGYQQSRFSYTPESRLLEIADNFRKRDIPCDVLHLDIDYMDGYRVFTWDNNKFPDPQETLDGLEKIGFKVVAIIDPAVKKDKGYKIYDEGIKNNYFAIDKDGIPHVNKVWPGDSLYPDFGNEKVRKWWGENQKDIIDTGVAGIWNDMNEPASFNGPLPDDIYFYNDGIISDHREFHNVYGHYMAKATYDGIKEYTKKRPFVITRACYAGTQKYSTVWTGDNQSLWEHLRMSLPMLMNLGLSGMSFCGADVGGFSFDCTSELLSRWVQVGAFTPLFRNHSRDYTRDQEPWAFDQLTEDINRKYIKLRYRLIPYLYDLMWEGESTGLAVIRPLLLSYQQDENTYEINDQFLCGDDILVAPIVEQGRNVRMVYLPQGDSWIDYWTNETFEGGQYIIKKAPLDICPIYIKSGSIIPNYPSQNYVGEKEIKELTLNIYPSSSNKESSYMHYQDDGESFEYRTGKYNLYRFRMQNENDVVSLKIHYEYGYVKTYESFRIRINKVKVLEVMVDDKKANFIEVDNGIEFLISSENKNCVIKTN